MGLFIQISQLVLCLSILVILHEFGHYITAKWFKMRVERFFLFFDPWFAIAKKKIGETVYGIGWLPLGGYVKIAGMIDESMDKEQMAKPPQAWEFRSKPAWQRLIVMLGGIIVNFFLAWLIYACIFSYWGNNYIKVDEYQKNGLVFSEAWKTAGFQDGDRIKAVDGKLQKNLDRLVIDVLLGDEVTVERDGKESTLILDDLKIKAILNGTQKGVLPFAPNGKEIIIDSVLPNNFAEKAGLKKGDKLVSINDEEIKHAVNLPKIMNDNKGKDITLQVIREGSLTTLNGQVSNEGKMGFVHTGFDRSEFISINTYGFFESIPYALEETFVKLKYQIKQFKLLIRPKTEAYKQVRGPLGIVKIFDERWNWEFFWKFTAMFSVWLAFLNLLPIPGLDGGHALFTIAEMVTGRTLNDKTMGIVQTIGMIFLLLLMALVFGNDIINFIQGNY